MQSCIGLRDVGATARGIVYREGFENNPALTVGLFNDPLCQPEQGDLFGITDVDGTLFGRYQQAV